MKRYLLFILAIGFGLIAFGQSRSVTNNKKNVVAPMIRRSVDIPVPGVNPLNLINSSRSVTTDPATMITRYDMQTNSSSGQQRLYYWPSDNTMSAVAIWSSQDATWSDRGTGYNYFNGTNWGSWPTSRVESVRTGWPSIQPYGANGECLLSHTSTTLRFCKRTTKGTGSWTEISLSNPGSVPAMIWARMVTSGSTHMNIHIIALTEPSANGGTTYNGMDGALLYTRSTDGGTTWGTWQQLPGMTSSNYLSFTADIYAFAQPHGDTLAFTVGNSWQDQFLMKSTNNGTSWTKTVIYNSPYNLGGNSSGFFYCPDGTMTVALDNQGIAHVVFGLQSDSGTKTASYFKPYTDGLVYWNETMPQLPQSLDPDILYANNQLVGWVQDTMVFYPPSGVMLANYYTSLSSQPTMVIDNNNILMLVWSSPTTLVDPNNYMLRHLYERTANIGTGTAITWNNTIYDLTSDWTQYNFAECQYPDVAQNTSTDNFFVLFQKDDYAGSYIRSIGIVGYAGQSSPDDNSMTVLTVSKASVGGHAITVTSPNGGESWLIGSVHNITWTYSGVTNVKIEYTANNGSSWNTIISSYPASSGTYAWTIPNNPSNQCKVRISETGNASVNDISNSNFTISTTSQSITVNSPNGGENWQVGGIYNINWTSSGITNVKIEYTTDNGSSWSTIISSYPANAGTYLWTIPNTPSTQCKVRISDTGNPSLSDMSDNVFTISTGSQSVMVTNPNGGETWQVGSVQNITWTSSGITNVKIEYTANNGSSWITITASYPANAGNYPWAVPNNPSTLCKVRISDSGNASISDISDNTFTISTGGQSTPEICIVTVDSTNNKNMIVWEKPYSTTIDHYNIYVESNQANVYTLIGSVPYSNFSIFTDFSSNSLQQANRYKISLVDIYNTETALSDDHMTIHLTINQGMGNTINLLWNSYEGFTYPSFNIFRGTSPTNMTLLATVASTLNSFTDLYPPGGYVYYKIEVVKPVPCSPSKTIFGSSVSNMSTNDPTVSAGPWCSPDPEVQIFPNPTTGLIQIISDRVVGEVNIYNSMGIQVKAFHPYQKEMTFDLSNLSKGVYYLRMNIENKVQVHKIVVL